MIELDGESSFMVVLVVVGGFLKGPSVTVTVAM